MFFRGARYNRAMAMDAEAVERNIRFLLQQQVEFAGNLQRIENVIDELREQLQTLTGLVQSLAQTQLHMLQRQVEMREEMDRRFAETDRRFAETDQRLRRLADLIERGLGGGNGQRRPGGV